MEFISLISTPRTLSIQSHISHGFVGNKAATFPLQTIGFDVDCINTVSLSNHPDYADKCKGHSLQSTELKNIIDGLDSNNLLNYQTMITGYTSKVFNQIVFHTNYLVFNVIYPQNSVRFVRRGWKNYQPS
jgi:pyridoxine kinase